MGKIRDAGFSVLVLSPYGVGFDIIVGAFGKNHLFEIKGSAKDKLTANEKKFQRRWKGRVYVVRSFDEILPVIARGY